VKGLPLLSVAYLVRSRGISPQGGEKIGNEFEHGGKVDAESRMIVRRR